MAFRRKASHVCGAVAGPRAQLQSLQIACAGRTTVCVRVCNDGAPNMCEPYDYTMHGEGQQPVLLLRASQVSVVACVEDMRSKTSTTVTRLIRNSCRASCLAFCSLRAAQVPFSPERPAIRTSEGTAARQ